MQTPASLITRRPLLWTAKLVVRFADETPTRWDLVFGIGYSGDDILRTFWDNRLSPKGGVTVLVNLQASFRNVH